MVTAAGQPPSMGLVLSAGGIYGAYQAGAWTALAGHLSPDLVVGVSVGALNGWFIAGGCQPEELTARWLDPSIAGLMRFRLPRRPWRGVFDPGPLEQEVARLCATYVPRLPLGVVTVELAHLRQRLFRSPALSSEHLLASCSLLGGFPPVRIANRWHCDGGLLGTLPIWAAVRMGATRVVAVDAMPDLPSPWVRKVLRRAQRLLGAEPNPGPEIGLLIIRHRTPLGDARDAFVWDAGNIRRWIEWGREDAWAALEQHREFWRPAASENISFS